VKSDFLQLHAPKDIWWLRALARPEPIALFHIGFRGSRGDKGKKRRRGRRRAQMSMRYGKGSVEDGDGEARSRWIRQYEEEA